MIRIRTIDPIAFAGAASEVLRAAWQPPSLDYSPELLQWLFSAPSDLAPIAIAVFEDDEVVGFVGAMGRRARFGGEVQAIYHSSFFSVRPGPGRGMVAPALMRSEAKLLRERARPYVVFAQEGSIGDQLLLNVKSLGFKMRKLGAYPIYGSVSKPVATVESRTVTPEEWLAACSRLELAGESILQLDLSAAELEYQLQDPWGRQCAVAYNTATQEIVGAGIAAHTRSVTAQGCQTMATLHHVRCTTADALRSLVWYASTWKDGEPRGPIVTLPNRTGISDEILRQAGVRAMPTRFFGYVFGQDESHPIFQAERTSFEVI